MASFSPPTPHELPFPRHNLLSPRRSFCSSSRVFYSTICRCTGSSDNNSYPIQWRWDSAIQDILKSAVTKFDSYVNLHWKDARNGKDEIGGVLESENGDKDKEDDDWDWDRWQKHFQQIDDQERLLSVLKSQLSEAVYGEDFEEAARLKVAIAAAADNDAVGMVMSYLNRAVEEECFLDAAFLRDAGGAGLVGWWAGVAEDIKDPYGLIIRISAEHGRYVARKYSPRQLATSATGVPLFEIFVTVNKRGQYKQKAVYLQKRSINPDSSTISPRVSGASTRLSPSGSIDDKSDLFIVSDEDAGDDDDTDDGSDMNEGVPGLQNILRDMMPGVKVKVFKVIVPGKADKDLISKVIEQMIEEENEDEDNDDEVEIIEVEDEIKDGSDLEIDEIDVDSGAEIIDNELKSEFAVKVIDGLVQRLSGTMPGTESLRVPAKLEKKGRFTFSFSIDKDINQQSSNSKEQVSARNSKIKSQRSLGNLISSVSKNISGGEKISPKVLKDVGDLLNLTLSQAQNHQPLSGSTTFHRIEIPSSLDPLDGLYVGALGLYSSEVIHLQRKFGQWQDDGHTRETSDLEFYEYVEAVKLTGDLYVPAGQVSFRAKIGKTYQLPHKGLFPEELGVVARYNGQGRLAEPGFRNPKWVDGDLVILDGQYIKGGPHVGFVYWAREYPFVVFFNQLRLQP